MNYRRLLFCLGYRNWISLLLFLTLLAPAIWAQDACTLLPLSLQERLQASTLVIEGKVISQQSFWDKRHENIYTSHQIEVYKVFKGTTAPTIVEIITEGGQVGLDLHVYSATLKLTPQQQGLFFLQPSATPMVKKPYQVYGSLQGFIAYDLAQKIARDPFRHYKSIAQEVYPALQKLTGATYKTLQPNVALETSPKPAVPNQNQRRLLPLINSFSPATLRAGTADVLTITGTNFGGSQGKGYVEFRNADNGGDDFIQPLPSDYVSWTDTEIKVKVPTNGKDFGTAGTGTFRIVNNDLAKATSPTPLLIIYAASNVVYKDEKRGIAEQSFLPRLIDQNGQGGYAFRFGASFENNKPALHGFKRAMNEWSCNTGINWNTVSRSAISRSADDGINSVRFTTSGELPANVLGRCVSRYSGCITTTGATFWVKEIDLEFMPRSDWQYGPGPVTRDQFDFESVVLHELGHGHQLSHLILPRAVMHFGVAKGQQSRTLNPLSDVAGGNFIIGLSTATPFCAQNAMQPRPASECAIPVELLELTGEYVAADNTVLLQWQTEDEENVVEFIVERSLNGVNFTPIGTVPATGALNTPRSYQFIDPDPAPVLTFYRLQLRRSSGRPGFSDIAEVKGPVFETLLAPNPGGGTTFLYYDAPVSDVLQLEIYDVAGRRYASFSVNVEPNIRRYQITLPNIIRGLCLIRYQGKTGAGTFRYVKAE